MKKFTILALMLLTACETPGEADEKSRAAWRAGLQEQARQNAATWAAMTPAQQERATECARQRAEQSYGLYIAHPPVCGISPFPL